MATNKSLRNGDVTGGAEWAKPSDGASGWVRAGCGVHGDVIGGVHGDVIRGLEGVATPSRGTHKKLRSCVVF